MQPLIFPNSSYLLVLNAQDNHKTALTKAALDQRLRLLYCDDVNELENAIDLMEKIVGLVVFESPTLEKDAISTLIGPKGVSAKYVSSSASNADIVQAVDDAIFELIPPELEAVLKDATGKIFPKFIENLPELKPAKKIPYGFDRQLVFSIAAGDVIGLGILRTKIKGLEDMFQNDKKQNALEVCQEAMNQCMGLVVQRMVKIGLAAKSGLPTSFDITSIPELQFLFFVPCVHVTDEKSRIAVSLGLIDISGKRVPLKGIEDVTSGTGDIEFL